MNDHNHQEYLLGRTTAWTLIQAAIEAEQAAKLAGVVFTPAKTAVQEQAYFLMGWSAEVRSEAETSRDKGFREMIEEYLSGTARLD